jgi:predicted metal-dependent hydrolase
MIPYTLVRSSRKTISIVIKPSGEVEVRCPKRCAKRDVEAFVASKEDWIWKHLETIAQKPAVPVLSETERKTLAEEAARILPEKVQRFAKQMDVSYGRITIRSQRTRWGSCSVKGNLNFNCLLMLCPEYVQDYVVIHELCHRKEMNHSAAFWAEVERHCPDYRDRRKWLKENGGLLVGRLP